MQDYGPSLSIMPPQLAYRVCRCTEREHRKQYTYRPAH